MIEQIALGFIEDNNRLIEYLEKYGSTLSDEELLEIKKNMEKDFKEQLKTILLFSNNKGHFIN